MAGGGGDLGGGKSQRRGKKGKRKAKKRLGFRLDMTPLVDITFLLLTFFMLTTSMITPQTMEMNVPPELDVPIEVKQSELLTVRLRDDGTIFYNMGMDAPEKIALKALRKVIVDQNVQLKNRCIVVLKASSNAPYGMVVTILDELNLAEPDILAGLKAAGINERKRKFTVAPMEAKDQEEIKGL
ncbi:MAG: biopolymer transporter ExbD [Candidatus Kapabacteria bacterium]|nr:biopolymer transporter ExbD [Candidatus Kapabacteria bacterium]